MTISTELTWIQAEEIDRVSTIGAPGADIEVEYNAKNLNRIEENIIATIRRYVAEHGACGVTITEIETGIAQVGFTSSNRYGDEA